MSGDNVYGVGLALSSSAFIGASFIVKKKGLIRARRTGSGASAGGYAYLKESLWWIGLLTMIVGEVANFTAYAFAPAILVTPLGALSVIISAVLASIVLKERLHFLGKVGCALCIVGSTVIVINAPEEEPINSIEEITIMMATNSAFQLYCAFVATSCLVLIFHYQPLIGKTNIMVYVTICSLVGSISVIGVKGLSIALKLTFSGTNQLGEVSFWGFVVLVVSSIMVQMNYLNKALDTFNTAVVTPIYYVEFTTATIIASSILFNGWGSAVAVHNASGGENMTLASKGYGAPQFLTVICGFLTIISGVFLLHYSREMLAKTTVPRSDNDEEFEVGLLDDEEEQAGIQMTSFNEASVQDDSPVRPSQTGARRNRSGQNLALQRPQSSQ